MDVPWNLATSQASSVSKTITSEMSSASTSLVDPLPATGPTSNAPIRSESATTVTPLPSDPTPKIIEGHIRTLGLHNFNKALKEITPSSSESLGSLADLRKWNEEFGEGKKDRKRQQVWGKDRFGFTELAEEVREEGRVASISTPSSEFGGTGVQK